jgi:hypothetical protein
MNQIVFFSLLFLELLGIWDESLQPISTRHEGYYKSVITKVFFVNWHVHCFFFLLFSISCFALAMGMDVISSNEPHRCAHFFCDIMIMGWNELLMWVFMSSNSNMKVLKTLLRRLQAIIIYSQVSITSPTPPHPLPSHPSSCVYYNLKSKCHTKTCI